jgi:hypothetical protein
MIAVDVDRRSKGSRQVYPPRPSSRLRRQLSSSAKDLSIVPSRLALLTAD